MHFKATSTNCCYSSNDPHFILPFNFLLLGGLCNKNLAWTRKLVSTLKWTGLFSSIRQTLSRNGLDDLVLNAIYAD